MRLSAIVEAAKAITGSDAETARRLGTDRQTVNGWRYGKSYPDFINAMKLAALTGIAIENIAETVAAGQGRTLAPLPPRIPSKTAASHR